MAIEVSVVGFDIAKNVFQVHGSGTPTATSTRAAAEISERHVELRREAPESKHPLFSPLKSNPPFTGFDYQPLNREFSLRSVRRKSTDQYISS